MKIAIVHDWLNGMRGGEKVLEVLCEIFPDAPVYTLFCDKPKLSQFLQERKIITSVLQKFPFVNRLYRHYLPFYVYAIEKMDLSGYDVIISISHCVAKGVRRRKGSLHICYCNTPVRYVWGFGDQYFGKGLKRKIIDLFLKRLKQWDIRSAGNVDYFIANAKNIADRIKRCYGRDTDAVIYPPVDTDFYTPSDAGPGDYFLVASALTPYKKADIAVEAFNELGYPLRVIGSGPEEKKLMKAAGKNVAFLGWQSGEALRENYRKCRALIFPGEEDFGIVPLEAQACGRPVIGFGKGGILETVVPAAEGYLPAGMKAGASPTGIFFDEQSPRSLAEAVKRFDPAAARFRTDAARENALKFSREKFKKDLREYILSKINK